MIDYFLYIKVKSFILGLKKPANIGIHLALLIIAGYYGWKIALLLNETDIRNEFIYIVSGVISGITIIRMVFPVYHPLKPFLPGYYPLSKLQHYLFSVFSDFTSRYFVYFILFILICSYYLDFARLLFLYYTLSSLFSAHLLRRFIQTIIDKKLRLAGYLFFITGLGLPVLFLQQKDFFENYLIYLAFLIPVYLLTAGYVLEFFIIENRTRLQKKRSLKLNLFLKLIVNNQKVRQLLLIGFSFKMLFLFWSFYMFKTKGEHLFDESLIYWFFISPLVLFTYVFNNVWGFWKNAWMTIELRSGSYKDMMKFMFRVMLIPLLIDTTLTLTILILEWDNVLYVVLFYLVSIISLVCFSFFSSLVFPLVIKHGFQFSGTSSFFSSLISSITVSSLTALRLNYWFYVLIPVFLVLAVAATISANDLYRERKYVLYNKLIKQ